MAIMLSVPLQLFPAVRIMENGIFERSGKQDFRVKWQKNIFRFATVVFCALVSYAGANDLDKFVSFVGSFAWCVLRLVRLFNLYGDTDIGITVSRSAMFTLPCCTTRHVREPVGRKPPTSLSWSSVLLRLLIPLP